ncbi:MAG: hypothetical protein WBG90_09265 [Saonia sp.]
MKRVLVPTDFTIASLQLIEYAILNFPKTKLDIILVSGFRMPDTRWGITHFSARREINKLTTESYAKAKRRLFREHSDVIEKVRIELFTGCNSFAFENFLRQLQVNDAIVPKGKFLQFKNSRCFDPTRLIKKSIKNAVEAPLETSKEFEKIKFSISNLLNL